jgi:hypothetical protein
MLVDSSVTTLKIVREIVDIQAGQCGNQIGAQVKIYIMLEI